VLFRKELDKAYDPNAPEDDMKEREEEMERMREHVFKESDNNKDHMISFDEFLAETQRDEFEKDPGWDTMDDEELYTDEEFQNFEHEREAQMPQGYGAYQGIPAMPPVGFGHPGGLPQGYPPQPGMYPPPQPGLYPPQPLHPAQQMQQQQQYGQVPQMHPGQFAPGPPIPGMDKNGVPMHGSVPGQPANPNSKQPMQGQPQQYQGQPQAQQFQGQPQGQQFQGQPQAQQFQGQPPRQAQQPPQGQGQGLPQGQGQGQQGQAPVAGKQPVQQQKP